MFYSLLQLSSPVELAISYAVRLRALHASLTSHALITNLSRDVTSLPGTVTLLALSSTVTLALETYSTYTTSHFRIWMNSVAC